MINHLHTLGCTTYMHIPHQQRQKIYDKSLKRIFIEYAIRSKAYRVFDPITEKMHVTRDVIFAEDN